MKKELKQVLWITAPFALVQWLYGIFAGAFESSMATNQLEDNKFTYSISQFISGGKLPGILWVVWVVLIIVVLTKNLKKGATK